MSPARRPIDQRVAVGVVYVAAMFMAIMDTTIVNVALPTLGRQFHVSSDAVDTVVIGFLVSLAVFMPASGWLGDRFGGRNVLLVAILIFTGASAACGFAQSLGELELFRILQGAGGGMLTPVGLAMLFRAFPPAERVRAASILIIPVAFAPTIGPLLGGLLVTDVSWRWVFFVNLPIGVAAMIFGLLFLEGQPQENPGPFDLAGFLLAGSGFGLLMYGLSKGPIQGWGTRGIEATIAGGIVGLVALVVVEVRGRQPMIDLRLYRDRLFRACTSLIGIEMMAFFGMLYLLALFYQDGLRLSALQSGLNTFPEALGIMSGSQIVTRILYPRFGPRRVMFAGLSVVASSLALMSLVGASTNLWWMRALVLTVGLGQSGVFVPAQAASMATISPASTGRASTLYNSIRQLGGAAGVAILTTVIAAVGPTHEVHGVVVPHLAAYHLAFLAASVLAVVSGIAILGVRDADAAPTMARQGAEDAEVVRGHRVLVAEGVDG